MPHPEHLSFFKVPKLRIPIWPGFCLFKDSLNEDVNILSGGLMIRSCLTPLSLILLISACDAPVLSEKRNIRVSSSIEMLQITSEDYQQNQEIDKLSGTWKYSKDGRQNKIPSMTFTKVLELPDYLLVPSCTSNDGNKIEEFDLAFLSFCSNKQLVRIELQKKNDSLCLTSFEDLEYTYDSNTKELLSFHSEIPKDTKRLLVHPLKDKLLIKNNQYNGYWKNNTLSSPLIINGTNYQSYHTVLPDHYLDKVLECFNVNFEEKPKNYLNRVTVYDIETYYMDNTYKVQTVYEDQITGDKCLMNQFQLEYEYKLEGSRITYLFKGSPMWSATANHNEDKLFL